MFHILLVEDNSGHELLTRMAFQAYDVEITCIDNGADAIDALCGAGGLRPDLILLDLNMPGTDGEYVLKALRSSGALVRQVPVIILTSSNAPEDRLRSYEHGANAYLTKPRRPQQYEAMAKTVVQFWRDWNLGPPKVPS